MKVFTAVVVLAVLAAVPVGAGAASSTELDEIRAEIRNLRRDYETRISALEQQLAEARAAAEQAQDKAEQAEVKAAQAERAAAPAPAATTASAFNPAMNVILDGKYRQFSQDPDDYTVPGFMRGEESGPGEEGFSLGESEININANIDDKFYGSLTVALVEEDDATEVELEEAFIQTLALPHGLTAKAGRFYSGVGYMNPFHRHTDDFADRPLPYRVMLDNQYGDDGVQLRWLAPTDTYLEFGAEAFAGDSFPANDGEVDTYTLFAHTGGDIGTSHSWRAGLSYLSTEAKDRESGDEDEPDAFTGDTDLLIADFVWKWAPDGNPYRTNFKLQGEYFWQSVDGLFTPYGGGDLDYDEDQTGWYLQGIYQFRPRWRIGARYAELDADDPGAAFAGTSLDTLGHTPKSYSAMLDWSNSEYSRVRLQYNRDESSPHEDDQWIIQYIMSLGAHGGHEF